MSLPILALVKSEITYLSLLRSLMQLRLITLLIVSTSYVAHGQVTIKADTLAFGCPEINQIKEEKFIIANQHELENSEFFNNINECMPFENIDFTKYTLVGYKYRGSNCHHKIKWSQVITSDNKYTIQFYIAPSLCRDLNFRLAWFIIDRLEKPVEIVFERLEKEG